MTSSADRLPPRPPYQDSLREQNFSRRELLLEPALRAWQPLRAAVATRKPRRRPPITPSELHPSRWK